MTQYVRFTDEEMLVIDTVYGGPQPDIEAHPNQGAVEDDDHRYLAYLESVKPAPTADPVDKLKVFLLANPDVAAILG